LLRNKQIYRFFLGTPLAPAHVRFECQ